VHEHLVVAQGVEAVGVVVAARRVLRVVPGVAVVFQDDFFVEAAHIGIVVHGVGSRVFPAPGQGRRQPGLEPVAQWGVVQQAQGLVGEAGQQHVARAVAGSMPRLAR
jgi:hypothetical protein